MKRTKPPKRSWEEKHILKIKNDKDFREIADPTTEDLSTEIEPWLTALFQSEHLSLLLGSGISSAVHFLATGKTGAGMELIPFSVFSEQITAKSKDSAELTGRKTANIEDQIRIVNELIKGLEIYIAKGSTDQPKVDDDAMEVVERELDDPDKKANTEESVTPVVNEGQKQSKDQIDEDKVKEKVKAELETLKTELSKGITNFAGKIIDCERNIVSSQTTEATEYLMRFLMSFASRNATRDRLNIFTLNYDRVVEFGAELAGIHLIDRFVGSISPIFRSSRLGIDLHYNPPGIRGEPRYLEGVVYFTKLHGSLDWIYDNRYVRRIALPYGAENSSLFLKKSSAMMIYPNASKDRETAEYPYVDLFRDFAAAVCCPNSTIVLYGYGFGDEHINRVIEDMLTIPSAHLVIISYDDAGGRAKAFYDRMKRPAQISLLIGSHFGEIKTLVDNYLPKPAIDKTTFRMIELLKARGWETDPKQKDKEKKNEH